MLDFSKLPFFRTNPTSFQKFEIQKFDLRKFSNQQKPLLATSMRQVQEGVSPLTVAGLAQSVEHKTAEREVVDSNPGPDKYSGS